MNNNIIDIIVSHYNEDINWLDNINIDSNIKVYSKTLMSQHHNNYEIINQPLNIGNEASSYLNYIVDNYYNLPEYMYFCHGHNFSEHQNYTNDFIINNVDYTLVDYLNVSNYYNIIDSEKTLTLLKYEKKTDNKPYLIINYFFENFLSKFLNIKSEFNSFSCAQFFVKRELVLSNSFEFYNDCLDWFYSKKSIVLDNHFLVDNNVYSSRVFEWLWYYIFTKQTNEKIIQLNNFLKKNK
jgi:hypothetical protein